MHGMVNPSFSGLTYHYDMCGHFTFYFPTQQVLLQKISSSVPLLNFGNSPLYTFLKLKKVEFVKNDFQKAQIVTRNCY